MLPYRSITASCALGIATLASTAFADTIELASPSAVAFGKFGFSVSGAPDIDGDGYGDFLVGAPSETVGATEFAGRVYVYSGRTGAFLRAHASPSPEFTGSFGVDMAGIGDINNDGRGDYIVGAGTEDGAGQTDSGRAYVYSGATGELLRTHTMPAATSFGSFGQSVDAVGDVTGDNRPDYIVGAWGADASGVPGGGSNGLAYIFSGATGSLVRTVTAPLSAAGGGFGWSVAGVPDVNGDGVGDFAVGAPFSDSQSISANGVGRAYIYSGANGALLRELTSPNEESNGQFGFHVAGVKDLSGDGLGDVLVGAWQEDADGINAAGRVYAFSGNAGTLTRVFKSPNPDSVGNFGVSSAGVGDRNGNGFEDLMVGASGDGGGEAASPGRAYVLDGLTGELLDSIQSPYATSGNRRFGYSVSAVPDANGDGLPDFVVGAFEDQGAAGLKSEGRAYCFRDLENDGCGSLFTTIPELFEGLNPFSNIGATGGGSGTGCTGANLQSDVFFTYTAPCNGSVTVSTCSLADFDTIIAAYQGCGYTPPFFLCNLSTLLACDDDGCGVIGGGSTITFNTTIGQCYRIRVGGYNGDQGAGELLVHCVPSCAGDFDASGVVDAADLSVLLGAWGSATAGPDIDNSGVVDAGDLATLLGNWGPC